MSRVVVVSDVRLYREGLAALLAEDGRLEVVGTANGEAEAVESLRRDPVEVMLLDMSAPGALSTVRRIFEGFPQTRVVALGISEERAQVLACAEAGVSGYVCRDSSVGEVVETAEAAVRDELRCSPRVAGALLRRVAKLSLVGDSPTDGPYLTPRESEVMELVDDGLTNQQIAGRLNIQLATVKSHLHNILEKLGVHHRGEAAARLRRCGMIRHRRRARPSRKPEI